MVNKFAEEHMAVNPFISKLQCTKYKQGNKNTHEIWGELYMATYPMKMAITNHKRMGSSIQMKIKETWQQIIASYNSNQKRI